MNPSAPSDREHSVTQAMILLYSWLHSDTIHSSFISACSETRLFKFSNTPKEEGKKKKKIELLFLTYTDYSIHLTQLLCCKAYLFRLIVSHLPGHKITVCTPSKHKVLMLTDCIFGQENTSKLRRKARLTKAGQSTGSADGLSTACVFREKLLGNGWRPRWWWGQSFATNSALIVVHNILAEWSSFPWIPQSMILNFKIL